MIESRQEDWFVWSSHDGRSHLLHFVRSSRIVLSFHPIQPPPPFGLAYLAGLLGWPNCPAKMTLLPLLAPPQSSSLLAVPVDSTLSLVLFVIAPLLFYSSTSIRLFLCQPHFYSLVQFPGQTIPHTPNTLQHTLEHFFVSDKQRSERTERKKT